jgi:hypothetical protein
VEYLNAMYSKLKENENSEVKEKMKIAENA